MLTESFPAAATLTWRSPCCRVSVSKGASMRLLPSCQLPATNARYVLCMPPSRIKACRARSVARSRATSRQPLVSRSRRCTSSSVSRGLAARRHSITPKLMPLPPCTAMPGGLSITSRCLSWEMIEPSTRSARLVDGCRGSSPASIRTGGRRISSPSWMRYSASIRLRFTRTSPLRSRR